MNCIIRGYRDSLYSYETYELNFPGRNVGDLPYREVWMP